MKVLIIPTWYPIGEDKLMGIYHRDFANSLNRFGIKADILFIDRERLRAPLKYLFMKKKEVINAETTTYIYKMLNLNRFGFHFQIKRYVEKLDKAFKNYLKTNSKPDVIHAMVTVPAGYAATVIGKKYNIPVVITEHGGLLERFFEKEEFKEYTKEVFDYATYSVVSSYMKDIVLKYEKECFILPNQVDTRIFKNDIKRSITNELNLVSVCALREGKNLDNAFKAIKILIKKGYNVHYDIIGEGFKEKYYKDKCSEEGLNDYVTFMGKMEKPQIAEVFKKEHALIISSELESFAISGIEALASGLPVITTDCKGPNDYMTEKTGIICKCGDPEDMAAAIEKLYNNYNSYKKENMVKMAQKFDDEEVVKIAEQIYEYAIKKSSTNN